MADKTPVRVVFNASNVATGMAEFQSGETVPVANGGTGLGAIGSAGQVIKVNAAGNALEFGAEGDLSITNLVAPTNADLTLTTSGTGNIVLDAITVRGTTFSAADSTKITFAESVDVTGTLTSSGLSYPTSDGTVGQFLKTDGSGTLSFANLSLGDLTIIGSTISAPSNGDLTLTTSGSGIVNVNDSFKIGSGATVTTILDEDAMGSNSATSLATQQSIKAYVDSSILTKDNTDEIAEGSTNLYFTNARADARITNALKDEDNMASNSATHAASQQSVKAYIDAQNVAQALTFVGDDSTGTAVNSGETFQIAGGTGLTSAVVNDTMTLAIDSTVATLTGSQTLTNKTLTAPVINSPTGDFIKIGGTNFTDSLLIGHATTGTLDSAEANTGVGIGTLDALTSGDRNTALGHDAGTGITTANNNTLIGYEAGKGITNANQNTVIGDSAFAGSNPESSSASNTVVGAFAMNVSSGAKENTAIGRDAGREVTSGDSNIFIGYNAGANDSTSGITTGSGNVIIGTVDPDSRTGDRQLKIAGNDGSTTTTWITGDNSGNLTFGGSAVVGDMTLSGSTIARDGGSMNITSGSSLTINVDGAIILDAGSGGNGIQVKDDGTEIIRISNSSSDVSITTKVQDKDLLFKGNDGGSSITAFTLDMSEAGAATFNDKIILGANKEIQFVDTNESIKSDGSKMIIKSGGTTFNLPTADGNAGDVLKTDGAGTLSFSSSAATASDDTRAVTKNNKSVSASPRTVDYFQSTSADLAWYFVALNDLTNDHSSSSCFAVAHNNSDAFVSPARGGSSGSSNSLPTTSADISSGQVRVKIAAPSADSKISYYKIPISRANTADATAGVTITTSNTDVDSASESIDTFAHASFRAAKYLILVDDNAKTETGVTEALVVHDGTNAFVSQYGTINTGNNDMITLSAAISGDNVVLSAAGLTPNLSLKIHKTLLSDSMSAVSNNNQKIIGATTVSSSATAFDDFDLDDSTAAVYYVVGKNATEGAFSVQEVYCSGAPGEASVTQGPFVSTKATTQLEFTAAFKSDADNSVELSVASTSGGSTVVNAYRINCLAE